MIGERKRLYNWLALGLVLLAAWLRLWQLNTIPPGFWFDEGYNAMDGVRIVETNAWPIFMPGNQGQEPLFKYLVALATTIFGETIYSVRVVSAFLGILSVALIYRWLRTLFGPEPRTRALALAGMAGLATSFVYVVMTRAGYRANTLLPLLLLVDYLFWRGWRTGKMSFYLAAGAGLGLAFYTYPAARLLPFVFILFIIFQTIFSRSEERASLKAAWRGLILMGGASALIGSPLLVFFLNHPEAFAERLVDVSLKVSRSAEGVQALTQHLGGAVRVLIDGQDPNWRHHLLGRPGFDLFNALAFWPGLLLAIRHFRRPANQFLISSLGVMWLPAALSEPNFHTLRLSGLLPAYYGLVALGLINIADWIRIRTFKLWSGKRRAAIDETVLSARIRLVANLSAVAVLLVTSGTLTIYDYFYRWAIAPEVYQAFEGPVTDLAHYLSRPGPEVNLIIPFHFYTHASARYLLQQHFTEQILMPPGVRAELSQREQVPVIVPEYPGDDGRSPAFVWLVRDETGQGRAYISKISRDIDRAGFDPELAGEVIGERDSVLARKYVVSTGQMLSLFPQTLPHKQVAYVWDDTLALAGYEFRPDTIDSGETSSLVLAWQVLGYVRITEKMFVQLLDSEGNAVGQREVEPPATSRKLQRWREDRLLLESIAVHFETDPPAGLYFVRLGFFEQQSGQRLPVYSPDRQPLGDEVILGPLYVKRGPEDPVVPQHPVRASLGDSIDLLGYSVSPSEAGAATEIELYWQAKAAVPQDYTVFVQVLDDRHQLIAQQDAQPLPGIYSTSRWQPGDIVSEKFVLALPMNELSNGNRLMTGMYDLATGVRLPAYNDADELVPDGLVQLRP